MIKIIPMTDIKYDVFISHAYEDKNTFTNELAFELKKKGLKVWYSGFELKIGDSITDSVNNALRGAKYAIVVISPVYLQKQWAMNELKALFNQDTAANRILPILHNITADEIKKYLPVMADRYAISSDKGLDFITHKIFEAVAGKHGTSDTPVHPGFITLGGPLKNENSSAHAEKTSDRIINTNNNKVTVNNRSSAGIIILIIIILITAFFIYQNIDSSSPGSPPPIDKSHSKPSNSE
jgi:hypothetical protein